MTRAHPKSVFSRKIVASVNKQSLTEWINKREHDDTFARYRLGPGPHPDAIFKMTAEVIHVAISNLPLRLKLKLKPVLPLPSPCGSLLHLLTLQNFLCFKVRGKLKKLDDSPAFKALKVVWLIFSHYQARTLQSHAAFVLHSSPIFELYLSLNS